MGDKFDQIKASVEDLTSAEKAALARTLIDQLDNSSDDDVEKLWAEEAQRRYEMYKSGALTALPGSEVMKRVRSRLR